MSHTKLSDLTPAEHDAVEEIAAVSGTPETDVLDFAERIADEFGESLDESLAQGVRVAKETEDR